MSIELKVPSFGESITEVVLGEWLKSPGDSVRQDDPVVVIETDKVTAELPAPADGVIKEILHDTGATVSVGDVVGTMEAGEAPKDEKPEEPEEPEAKAEKPKSEEPKSEEPKSEEPKSEEPTEERPAPKSGQTADPDRVMPAARRLLAEHGLDASEVKATGPGGRLLKEDVQRHLEQGGKPDEPTDVSAIRYPDPATMTPPAEDEVVPMSPMRKRIAERLVASQQSMALLTTFNEIDMTAVQELRRQYKQTFEEKYGIKLGLMSFFVKAAIEALKLVPGVNAEIRDDNLVYHNHYDIGVAVGGGKGLVVPVIRRAELLGFAEIEETIADFAVRAKNGKLSIDELQGGTFTISNGGVFGSMLSTPIVNPPQSGVLGLHAIQDRPVAIDGQVVIRPMMYVALTYDHRIVDGREGVTFLKRVKECMESPARILLEI